MKIACSGTGEGRALCWIGCECKMANGWSGGSTMSANGTLSTASAGGKLNSDYTIKDDGAAKKTTSSANPGISTMATGDSCTISVTDPRYGVTCTKPSTYDCAGVCGGSAYYTCTSGSTSSSCSSGFYSVYLGKQKCSSGSATGGSSCYTCNECTYSCSSGYSTSTTSCDSGYTLKTETASTQSGCPTKKCGKCEQGYFTLRHWMRISMFYLDWSIQNSSGEIIDSGSLLANDRDGNEYEKTYQVPAGNYTVTYTAKGWVPCNEQGMPGNYCACKNESSGIMGGDRETLTFTVNKDGVNVPFRLPACGHAGCKSYPCKGGSAGFQPVDPDTGLVETTLP